MYYKMFFFFLKSAEMLSRFVKRFGNNSFISRKVQIETVEQLN